MPFHMFQGMFQGNLSAGREAAFLSLLMLGAKEGGSLELSPLFILKENETESLCSLSWVVLFV